MLLRGIFRCKDTEIGRGGFVTAHNIIYGVTRRFSLYRFDAWRAYTPPPFTLLTL
jgi:hypothetical protein